MSASSIEVKTYRSVTEVRFELRDGERRATWIYDPRGTGIFFVMEPPQWDDGTPMERAVADALHAASRGWSGTDPSETPRGGGRHSYAAIPPPPLA